MSYVALLCFGIESWLMNEILDAVQHRKRSNNSQKIKGRTRGVVPDEVDDSDFDTL
jgi:hypothetical protein